MCHAHTTELLLQEKMSAITDCFINSSSPPKLQVDIPIAMADDLCEKPVGPYMFREAQVSVVCGVYVVCECGVYVVCECGVYVVCECGVCEWCV